MHNQTFLRAKADGEYNLTQECTWEQESGGLLETVFENGKLVREQSLSEIRDILKGQY